MRAYEACRFLVEEIGPRWIGSEGEERAGDWIETEFRRLGLATRRLWFDCPSWDYRSTDLTVDGRHIEAGAQMFSPACAAEGELALVSPDGKGGFTGDVAGKIALLAERGTGGVLQRSKLLANLKSTGALAAVGASGLPKTWSTKMFRDPKSDLPAAAVSGESGAELLARPGARARLVIDARPRPGRTSEIIGEIGLEDAPVILLGAHYDAAPYSPGAEDNAAGVGLLLDLAERVRGANLARRLRFCAFSGHEFGGDDARPFGSKSYVRDFPDELKRVELMLNFDGVGASGTTPKVGVSCPRLLERVRAWASPERDVVVTEGPDSGSDNGVFVAAGIPAAWLQSEGARDYFAQVYHSPLDDMRWVGRSELARSADAAFSLLSDLMK